MQILLSTFNGEKVLQPLLESVLAQTYTPCEVLVRDDGSTDGTLALLQRFAARHPMLSIIEGEHCGYIKSFLTLLHAASPTAAYVALCDQDDIWRPDKIARAVSMLERHNRDEPLLYCSRVEGVTVTLEPLAYSPQPIRPLSFANALVECPVHGCTMVLNAAGLKLLQSGTPQRVFSHDWWVYLVFSAFGHVLYDSNASVLYRRHDANVSDFPNGLLEESQVQWRRFLTIGKYQPVWHQAKEFQRLYGMALPEERRTLLTRFVAAMPRLWDRIRYVMVRDVYRQRWRDDKLLPLLILLNRL